MQTKAKHKTFKIPVKLYRIGELVDYTPFSRQTIHNYTIMGLIRETKWSEGGHRLYDESVFERLSEIMQLKKTKTLIEIRQILGQKHSNIKVLSTEQTSSTTVKESDQNQKSTENN